MSDKCDRCGIMPKAEGANFCEECLVVRGQEIDAAYGCPPGYTLFPPKGAKIVYDRPVRSDKWQAAERLARLVLEILDSSGSDEMYEDDRKRLTAEAKRVLGEEA